MKLVRLVVVAATASTLVAGTATAATATDARVTAPRLVPHRVAAAASRPEPVSSVRAFQDGATVTLGWTVAPSDARDRLLVSYLAGKQAPQRPADGTHVRLRAPGAGSAVLRALATNTTYSASIWTRRNLHLSRRATIHFATVGALPTHTATLSGVVTDTAHHPLAGVAVGNDSFGTPTPFGAVTGADGAFDLQMPSGTVFLAVDGSRATGGESDATGYVPDFRAVRLRSGQSLQLSLALAAGAAASGRVLDAAGAPVAGAVVFPNPVMPYVDPERGNVFVSYATDATGGTTTGSDGSFEITGLPEQAQTLCVDSTMTDASPGDAVASACSDTPLQPAPGSTTVIPDIVVPPAARATGTVRGVVRDSAHVAAANAFVYLEGLTRRSGYASTTTDPTGHYSVAVTPGRYQVCVEPEPDDPNTAYGDVGTCSHRAVTVAAGDVTTAGQLNLPPAGAVSGVIRTLDGSPVAGAVVSVAGEYNKISGVTDARGRYVITSAVPGLNRVCVSTGRATAAGASGGVIGACDHRRAVDRIEPGKLRIGMGLRLRAGGILSGTVTGPDEQNTFSGVTIKRADAPPWVGRGVPASQSGHFHVSGLAPGRYTVCADIFRLDSMSDGVRCSPSSVRVVVGRERSLDYAVPSSGRIVVSATDGGGDHLAGVDAVALGRCNSGCRHVPSFGTPGVRVRSSWVTGAAGNTTLNGLHRGDYAVCGFGYLAVGTSAAPPTGFADGCSGDTFSAHTEPGAEPHVSLVLGPAGEVTGTVTASDGIALPGVTVHVSGSAAEDIRGLPGVRGSAPLIAARTDVNGRFAVRSVAPGEQTVCFDATKVVTASAPHGFMRQCYGGQPGAATGSPVPVAADDVTSGVDIGLTPQP